VGEGKGVGGGAQRKVNPRSCILFSLSASRMLSPGGTEVKNPPLPCLLTAFLFLIFCQGRAIGEEQQEFGA
jgi:hypothetical protein